MGHNLLAGCQIEASDGFFDARNQRRTCAEFVDAQTNQEGGVLNVTCEFSADPDPDACIMSGIDDHLEDADNGWV